MRFLTYLFLSTLVTACGEVSYKQGGSAQDIERAHQACRGTGDQLSACLANQGWKKPQIDAFDPLFATISATDNRQPNPYSTSPIVDVAPKQTTATRKAAVVETPQKQTLTVKPASTDKAAVTTNQEETPKQTGSTVAVNTPGTTQTAASTSTPEAAPSASTIHDGPDVTYAINSWWKMGGFPDQLARDQRSCEKKLGTNYLPDYKTQTYKRAFVVCMHEAGWVALRDVK